MSISIFNIIALKDIFDPSTLRQVTITKPEVLACPPYQRGQGPLRHRPEKGRGCLPSGECRETGDRTGGLPSMHSCRDTGVDHTVRRGDGWC